jgi:large subunit ribosomal protein L25
MAKAKATTQQTLTVKKRTTQGKRPVARMRQDGLVPGVVYGKETKPVAVAVNQRELARLLHAKAGEHALVTIRVEEDGKPWEKPALVQDVQHDPVDGRVLHVDFHTILLTEKLKVKVALLLKGEPVGVKQDGGVLEHFLREVEVECLPTDIPEHVEHDISAMTVGQTIHVSDLAAPAGTKITSDPASPICSVQMPKVEKPEEAAEAAPTEPEVLREKKEEPEGAGAEAGGKGEKGAPEGKKEGGKKE